MQVLYKLLRCPHTNAVATQGESRIRLGFYSNTWINKLNNPTYYIPYLRLTASSFLMMAFVSLSMEKGSNCANSSHGNFNQVFSASRISLIADDRRFQRKKLHQPTETFFSSVISPCNRDETMACKHVHLTSCMRRESKAGGRRRQNEMQLGDHEQSERAPLQRRNKKDKGKGGRKNKTIEREY